MPAPRSAEFEVSRAILITSLKEGSVGRWEYSEFSPNSLRLEYRCLDCGVVVRETALIGMELLIRGLACRCDADAELAAYPAYLQLKAYHAYWGVLAEIPLAEIPLEELEET